MGAVSRVHKQWVVVNMTLGCSSEGKLIHTSNNSRCMVLEVPSRLNSIHRHKIPMLSHNPLSSKPANPT